jgi:hypothetical protein
MRRAYFNFKAVCVYPMLICCGMPCHGGLEGLLTLLLGLGQGVLGVCHVAVAVLMCFL